MCLSIGTPKNNKFSICPKWKIHYFQVSQNLGRVQPHYNGYEYWDTYKTLRGPGFDTRSGNILSFLLPLFQEGQLSVTGESMCTKYWLTA